MTTILLGLIAMSILVVTMPCCKAALDACHDMAKIDVSHGHSFHVHISVAPEPATFAHTICWCYNVA